MRTAHLRIARIDWRFLIVIQIVFIRRRWKSVRMISNPSDPFLDSIDMKFIFTWLSCTTKRRAGYMMKMQSPHERWNWYATMGNRHRTYYGTMSIHTCVVYDLDFEREIWPPSGEIEWRGDIRAETMCSIPIILKYCYTKLGKKKFSGRVSVEFSRNKWRREYRASVKTASQRFEWKYHGP